MKRNLVGAALIGAALIIGGTGVASAAPAGCTGGGWVCLYRDDDFRGGQVSLNINTPSISHLSSYGFNDNADSYYSNHGNDSAWYTDANYNGRRVCMHSYTSNRSFSFQDSDEASSARRLGSPTAC